VERLMLLASEDTVDSETVPLALPQTSSSGGISSTGSLAERVQGFERQTILSELRLHHYNVSNAAKALDLERSHLYKKAEQLGIDLRAVRRQQDS
jgi:two-component system nitrogen regulation response regulator NtrX